MSFEITMIEGFLGRDPELKIFENGTKVCHFSVAVNKSVKDKNGNKVAKTKWFNVSIFGKKAEIAAEYLRKGCRVFLQGEVEARQYLNKGVLEISYEMLATDLRLVDKLPEQGDTSEAIPANNELPAELATVQ